MAAAPPPDRAEPDRAEPAPAAAAAVGDLPDRAELVRRVPAPDGLDGPALAAQEAAAMAAGRPVLFMPTSVYEDTLRGYCLYLFGTLPSGARARVELQEVPIFCEALVPVGQEPEAYGAYLQGMLQDAGLPWQAALRQARPLQGYCPVPRPCWRLGFERLAERRRAIELLRASGVATAADDTSSHHRKVARELGVSLTDWLVLRGYRHRPGGALAEHVFEQPAAELRSLVSPLSPDPRAEELRATQPQLLHDRTLVLAWDIETWTAERALGTPPTASNPGDHIFMICASLHYKDYTAPLAAVCLALVEVPPAPGRTALLCADERALILAFGELVQRWAPDVVAGFNDGQYDWPFLLERAEQLGAAGELVHLLGALPGARPPRNEGALRWVRRQQQVKLDAERSHELTYPLLPGWVALDVRLAFMRLFPKEKSSLRRVLELNGLESKADLAVHRMWNHYEAARAARGAVLAPGEAAAVLAGMGDVAHYCQIDAQRCQDLLVRRNVLGEQRDVGSLACVSLHDCLVYAGGLKVRNMTIAHANLMGLACSNISVEREGSGKYPGALVIDPQRGLECELPVTGLDFASLYPSIIMTYNLSPEYYVGEEAHARALAAAGVDLHYVEFPYRGSTCRGWFVRHGNRAADQGIYPRVLLMLFARRAALKVDLKQQATLVEQCRSLRTCLERGEPAAPPPGLPAAAAAALAAACAAADPAAALARLQEEAHFRHMAVDSRQKAAKVFMNSFYGEAGNPLSPFFLPLLAGGVTQAGRAALRHVYAYVLSRGYGIKYGDTDSLYVTCPPAVYAEARARFEQDGDRRAYDLARVNATMQDINRLRGEVNDELCRYSGSTYLTMAYEEVLFPSFFAGRKRYAGMAYMTRATEYSEELFVRGLDVVRQDRTGLLRAVGHRVLAAALAPGQAKGGTMLPFVEEALAWAVGEARWDLRDFVLSATWKPAKNNQSVQLFMRRMRARHRAQLAENAARAAAGQPLQPLLYVEPEPGERFDHVVLAPLQEYDLYGGRVRCDRKGDRTEYLAVAERLLAEGRQVDLAYYLEQGTLGFCARLALGDPRFAGPAGLADRALLAEDEAADAAAKAADAAAHGLAEKYLRELLRRLMRGGRPAPPGAAPMRRAFQLALAEAQAEGLGRLCLQHELFLGEDPRAAVEGFLAAAREACRPEPQAALVAAVLAGRGIGADGRDLPAQEPRRAAQLFRLAADLAPRAGQAQGWAAVLAGAGRREAALRARLQAALPALGETAAGLHAWLEVRVQAHRAALAGGPAAGPATPLRPLLGEGGEELEALWRQACDLSRLRLLLTLLQQRVRDLRAAVLGTPAPPTVAAFLAPPPVPV